MNARLSSAEQQKAKIGKMLRFIEVNLLGKI